VVEVSELMVGTLVSPIEGLKPLVSKLIAYLFYLVGTLVSPIEGLKLPSSAAPKVQKFGRNACKPD